MCLANSGEVLKSVLHVVPLNRFCRLPYMLSNEQQAQSALQISYWTLLCYAELVYYPLPKNIFSALNFHSLHPIYALSHWYFNSWCNKLILILFTEGIAIDKNGLIYFVDGTMIRKVDQNGIISTLLGSNDLTSARPLTCDTSMHISQVSGNSFGELNWGCRCKCSFLWP